jgi:hypothetical protein
MKNRSHIAIENQVGDRQFARVIRPPVDKRTKMLHIRCRTDYSASFYYERKKNQSFSGKTRT